MLIKSTLTKQNISKIALDVFVWETDIKRNKSGGDKIAKTTGIPDESDMSNNNGLLHCHLINFQVSRCTSLKLCAIS